MPPARAEHASDIANADNALNRVESVVQEAVRLADEAVKPQAQSNNIIATLLLCSARHGGPPVAAP